MKRVAHNFAVSSTFNESIERYMHNLSVVISDLDESTNKIEKSEQVNMLLMPVMETEQLVHGLRAFADHIERYSKTGESGDTVTVNQAAKQGESAND